MTDALVAKCFSYAENDQEADLEALLGGLDDETKQTVLTSVNAEGSFDCNPRHDPYSPR